MEDLVEKAFDTVIGVERRSMLRRRGEQSVVKACKGDVLAVGVGGEFERDWESNGRSGMVRALKSKDKKGSWKAGLLSRCSKQM